MLKGRNGLFIKGGIFVLLMAVAFWVRVPVARAVSAMEKSFLAMYFTEDELYVISSTRSLQSISRVAENISVVTADDIELMNAHTLAEVLNTLCDVQVDFTGGFGSVAMVHLQGSGIDHVTILLDGVPLNNIGDNMTEVGFFPVTDIERIEVVKGPASSAWGSALGGVINVITKGTGSKILQGSASVDYGTENSLDYRAAISGRSGRFGYYLSGTGLRTDGLTDGFDVDTGFVGMKLDYAVAEHTSVNLSLAYGDGSRGDGNSPADDLSWDSRTRQLVSRLSVASAVGREGNLDLALWRVQFEHNIFMRQLSDSLELTSTTNDSNRSGIGLKYTWSHAAHGVVVGTDYAAGDFDTSSVPDRILKVDQWAVYANDTISLGPLSVTPGIRYDDVSISDHFWSPSLGLTYALRRNALLRATVARGFSVPTPVATAGSSEIYNYEGNPDLTVEKVWSYQAGFETNVLDASWVKVAAFRHDVDDAFADVDLPSGAWTTINKGRQRRQGVEVEMRTVPYHHLTFAAGAAFIKAEDLDTHEDVLEVPKRQFNVSLKYDDERSFRALLTGNYREEDYPARYNADIDGFMVDLNLIKKVPALAGVPVEVFLNVHNLFNQSQYYADIYKNPERWVEGGCRVSF